MATATKEKDTKELFKDWTVKGFKTFRGHDGDGFNANLYYQGKKVCEVDDDAWGGGYSYHWLSKDAKKVLEEIVKVIPPYQGFDTPLDYDMDLAISAFLIQPIEEEKYWRNVCRKGLVFIKEGQTDGAYSYYKGMKYTPDLALQLRERYPNLVEIVNERFLK